MTTELRILKSEIDGTGVRVLVVEDSVSDLFWLEMVFKGARLPYILEIACDGLAAKKYLEDASLPEHPDPDLILLDVNLPGPPAGDILDCLTTHPRVPLFMISGCEIPEVLRQRVGQERCFLKPFTNQQLMSCLKAVEGRSRTPTDALPADLQASLRESAR